MEELIVEQRTQFQSIYRATENFAKLRKDRLVPSVIKNRLENLNNRWEKCELLHLRITAKASKEQREFLTYFTKKEFEATEEEYFEASDILSCTLHSLNQQIPQPDPSLNNTNQGEEKAFALPKVDLPKFDGNFARWIAYRDTFESLVINNAQLSNIQRMYYLKASLRGDAAMLVEHVKVAEANFVSAWELLIAEYDNSHTLVHSLIDSFAGLPVMKSENATELKWLRDTLNSSLAALRNLERSVDSWDDLLVYLVSKKFSYRMRQEWNLKTSDYPSYKRLTEFLNNRIRGLTEIPSIESKTAAFQGDRSNKSRASVNNINAMKCPLCSNAHMLHRCEQFLQNRKTKEKL